MNDVVTTLIDGEVYTAEEILKVKLHQMKHIYNRPTLYLNANTVDGNKTIHINAQDIVRGYHKHNKYTQAFLKLKFEVGGDVSDDIDSDVFAVYVGELADIEPLLNVAVFLDHQCRDSGTTYISTVKPANCSQAFHHSEGSDVITSPYTRDTNKIHPTILESMKKVKANNNRVFVD